MVRICSNVLPAFSKLTALWSMAYKFKLDEPIEKGFRRIAREQLQSALAELAHEEVKASNVHECRKSLKRLRALVRLAADAVGASRAKRRIGALGEIALLLSAQRDQTVILQTIARLAEQDPDTATAMDPFKRSLSISPGDESKPLDSECAAKARVLLLREVKKFARMNVKGHGLDAVACGLETSYRKARAALRTAYDKPSDESVHSLRKAVQWHWRQMTLLSRAWPEEFELRAAAARELSQLLGDDHDLSMVIAAAEGAPNMSRPEKDRVIGICVAGQQGIRHAAEHRAERLFAERPRAFVNRISIYWRYSRIVDAHLAVGVPSRQDLAATAQPQVDGQPVQGELLGSRAAKPALAKPRLATQSDSPAPSQRRA